MMVPKMTDGLSLDGEGDNWVVQCPDCDNKFEFQGFLDPEGVRYNKMSMRHDIFNE